MEIYVGKLEYGTLVKMVGVIYVYVYVYVYVYKEHGNEHECMLYLH